MLVGHKCPRHGPLPPQPEYFCQKCYDEGGQVIKEHARWKAEQKRLAAQSPEAAAVPNQTPPLSEPPK